MVNRVSDQPGRSGADNGYQTSPTLLLHVQNVDKQYGSGENAVTALRHVNLAVGDGQFIAIRGRSGAGKTTLLNIIAGLDNPSSGRVMLFGRDLSQLSEGQRTQLRRRQLGFVFQAAHLITSFTARENVEVPLRLARTPRGERERRSHEALALVGLAEREQHRAPELSGGEQQRVAIARALVHAPRLVLADEPTGNLDSRASDEMMTLLGGLAAEGITIVLVTHEPDVAARARRVIVVHDGRIQEDRAS